MASFSVEGSERIRHDDMINIDMSPAAGFFIDNLNGRPFCP